MLPRADFDDIQFRSATKSSVGEYIDTKGWRLASSPPCQCGKGEDCVMTFHGTYARKHPEYMEVPRWRCRLADTTFSKLPDCLAAQMPGALQHLEDIVVAWSGGASLASLAREFFSRSSTSAGRRHVKRTILAVERCLRPVPGLRPDLFSGFPVGLMAMREQLGTTSLLVDLREQCEPLLPVLRRPLGFLVEGELFDDDWFDEEEWEALSRRGEGSGTAEPGTCPGGEVESEAPDLCPGNERVVARLPSHEDGSDEGTQASGLSLPAPWHILVFVQMTLPGLWVRWSGKGMAAGRSAWRMVWPLMLPLRPFYPGIPSAPRRHGSQTGPPH